MTNTDCGPDPETGARHAGIFWAFLALVTTAYLAFPNATVDLTPLNADDSGFYLALGNSVAHGWGYTLYQPPLYAPSSIWPPVFPLLLTSVISVFGLNLLALKCLLIVIGLAGIILVRRFFSLVLPTRWATSIAVFTALSPLYFSFSHQTMADLPILLCVLGSLWRLDVWSRTGFAVGGSIFWSAVGSVVISSLTKPQAVILIALPVVQYLADRRGIGLRVAAGRLGAFVLVASLPFALWTARAWLVERNGYQQTPQIVMLAERQTNQYGLLQVGDLFARGWRRTFGAIIEEMRWRTGYVLAEAVLPVLGLTAWRSARFPGELGLLIVLIVLSPIALGWLAEVRRREALVSSFFALHIALVVVSPYQSNPRYFVVLLPFAAFYFLHGIEQLTRYRMVPRLAGWLVPALCIVPLVVFVDGQRRHPYAHDGWTAFVGAAEWAREALPADAVMLTHNWSEFHILSGRATYPFLSPPGVDSDPWRVLGRRPHLYLVEPKSDAFARTAYLNKLPSSWKTYLAAHHDEQRVVFENEFYRILALSALPLDVILAEFHLGPAVTAVNGGHSPLLTRR
jgi:hypothetical protein